MIHTLRSGQKMYYELTGNYSSGKTIVFLNGLSQSTLSWSLMTQAFISEYKILLLDFIFQGQSDKTGEYKTFDEHASDLNEITELLHMDRFVLCGISYGSLVAQHYAVNYPDRIGHLVLMSTFAHKTPYFEAIENSWWKALELGGYSLLLDVMLPSVLSENYFHNPLIPIELMKKSRKEINEDPQALFKLMKATKEQVDYRQELKKVKAPTLILHGEKDLLVPLHLAEAVHQSISRAELEVYSGIGHTLNLEAFKECADSIQRFLLKEII